MNLVVLQAAVLFIIAFRRDYDAGELWILTGTAIRIEQRLGLYHESNVTKLSVLEVEISRRLWWQMSVLDARSTERCGVGASFNQRLWETARPLNVNGNDLRPEMTVLPLNHVGATEMMFPLMMYEVGAYLRHSKSMAAFDGSLQKLSESTAPLVDKDRVIDELEDMLERQFLRYCDPAIPLHIIARGGVKLVLSRIRLTIRHPRRYPDRGINLSTEERQNLFSICLSMIEQDNLLHATPCLRGFWWNLDLQSQLDAVVYLLSELRVQGTGSTADRVWSQISEFFAHHPDIITNTKRPLYIAVRSLTIKSWESRESKYTAQASSPSEGSSPLFISQIRSYKASNITDLPQEPSPHDTRQFATTQALSQDIVGGFLDNTNPNLVLGPLATDLDTIDWNYWNDLMQGAESSEAMTYGTQEIFNHDSTSINMHN